DDMPGLRKYFEENIMPTNERMNQGKYRLQKLSKLKDSAIKGLISNKIIYAMNQGIDVFVDLIDEIKDISVNTIDLCRVLGIYMDNAIEAAKECVEKEIKFNVVKEDNSVTFVLMNSFVNHGLSLTDMEKQNVSSKGEGRGLGLNNVNEILSRYDNVNKVTEIKDNYFIQTLIIDKSI
ncbi:MAG: GHKL domain-containing protein, partial [Eubacterium sp.]|nr:GHKL domain-containing protein [Eubacterium sp.]